MYCLVGLRLFSFLVLCAMPGFSGEIPLPRELVNAFRPPDELAKEFGAYRSPLLFENGERVQTPQDWERRRKEIQQQWHSAMGAWPALLDRPRIEYLKSRERDGFLEHKVRVQVAIDQSLVGYLLV